MRKWTSRLEGFVQRTGAALDQADANIDAGTSSSSDSRNHVTGV